MVEKRLRASLEAKKPCVAGESDTLARTWNAFCSVFLACDSLDNEAITR